MSHILCPEYRSFVFYMYLLHTYEERLETCWYAHWLTLESVFQGSISPVTFRLVSCLGSLLLEPWHTHMSPPLAPWRKFGHKWVCVLPSVILIWSKHCELVHFVAQYLIIVGTHINWPFSKVRSPISLWIYVIHHSEHFSAFISLEVLLSCYCWRMWQITAKFGSVLSSSSLHSAEQPNKPNMWLGSL